MIYLNIGEPDFTAPPPVLAAADAASRDGRTQYTEATGLPALRERDRRLVRQRFGLAIDPARIVVTAGASAALQLACLALVDAGDEVLMPDPSYPCNRHFVAAADGRAGAAALQRRATLPARAPTASRRHWTPRTRGVLLASPSNPTGTSIGRPTWAASSQRVRARGGFTIVDEIYLGLSYDDALRHECTRHDWPEAT